MRRRSLPRRIDSLLVRYASRSFFDEVTDAGCEIREFTGGLLHTKSITVDGEMAMFGTANFDMRSLFINMELMLRVHDAAFAAHVRRYIEGEIARSQPITRSWYKAHTGVLQRLRQFAAYLLIAVMPVLAGAVTMTLTDRHFGTHFFNAAEEGKIGREDWIRVAHTHRVPCFNDAAADAEFAGDFHDRHTPVAQSEQIGQKRLSFAGMSCLEPGHRVIEYGARNQAVHGGGNGCHQHRGRTGAQAVQRRHPARDQSDMRCRCLIRQCFPFGKQG